MELTLLIGGIAIGAVYALVAIGIVLIFRATGILNFGQGELVMVGAYAYFLSSQYTSSPLLQLAATVLAGLLGGLLFYFTMHVLLRQALRFGLVIGTLAMSILLQAGARLAFTDLPRRAEPWLLGDTSTVIAGVSIESNSVVIIF